MLLRRLLLAVGLGVVAAALLGAAPARASGSIPWCGTGEPTTDQPDSVLAFEWHVVYAVPSNSPDNFASYAPRFAGDVQAMTNWWVGQDPTRRPRFDLLDAPSCGSEAGRVDITFLRLPQPAGAASFDDVVADLTAAGLANPDKAYLVYFDDTPHVGTEGGLCGLTNGGGTAAAPAIAYSVVYVQACSQDYNDDWRRLIAMHEMTHGMGAVPPEAPHYCNDGHVCDSPNDLMKAVFDSGDWLGSVSLDVGHDDYYAHSGSWWDVQDSLLLYRLDDPQPPPPPIVGLTATSIGDAVDVTWKTVTPAGGAYMIYAPDGTFVDEPVDPSYTTTGTPGQILEWRIETVNSVGFLSPSVTLRFKVGYGIVDANGALLQDTVAPASVAAVKVSRSKKNVVLRWAAVTDPIGIRGYRVTVPGVMQKVVRTTSIKLPLARVRGKRIQVRTLDEAGNAAAPAVVTVRR